MNTSLKEHEHTRESHILSVPSSRGERKGLGCLIFQRKCILSRQSDFLETNLYGPFAFWAGTEERILGDCCCVSIASRVNASRSPLDKEAPRSHTTQRKFSEHVLRAASASASRRRC
eukprot:scaffold124451_cov14-Tisochrysis_lutea.AAC.1